MSIDGAKYEKEQNSKEKLTENEIQKIKNKRDFYSSYFNFITNLNLYLYKNENINKYGNSLLPNKNLGTLQDIFISVEIEIKSINSSLKKIEENKLLYYKYKKKINRIKKDINKDFKKILWYKLYNGVDGNELKKSKSLLKKFGFILPNNIQKDKKYIIYKNGKNNIVEDNKNHFFNKVVGYYPKIDSYYFFRSFDSIRMMKIISKYNKILKNNSN